ncbi:MAG: hypothetical protein SH847_09460 [Roseiflexaceae bacterium]|nr:hypothetical protein [Roseiflexaceae bacterium]
MINWYEMYTLGRDAHTERISEAQQQRLVARRAIRAQVVTLRSRLGQTLINVGRWVDGRSDVPAHYDVERNSVG